MEALILTVLLTSVPLIFAATGELVAERSGVLNLGVEGMMLMGAVAAFAVTSLSGNPYFGIISAEESDQITTIDKKKDRIRPENSEVNRLFGDYSLLNALTGWKPTFLGLEGLRSGLKITSEWFSNPKNLCKYRVNKYMI